MTDKLDVTEGRRLLEVRRHAEATGCAAPWDDCRVARWLYDNREALIAAAEPLKAQQASPGHEGETLEQTVDRHVAVFMKAYDTCDEAGRRAMVHMNQVSKIETLLVWREQIDQLREERGALAEQLAYARLYTPRCVDCGNPVEPERYVYVRPTCYACLPPPEPIETIGLLSEAGGKDI